MKVTLWLTECDLDAIQHICFMTEVSKSNLMEKIRNSGNTEEERDENDQEMELYDAISNLMDKIYWVALNEMKLSEEKKKDSPENGLPYETKPIIPENFRALREELRL